MSFGGAGRGRFQMQGFKEPARDQDLVNRNWHVLKAAIREIFEHNAGSLSFEELYRAGYNMVLHRCGEVLYNNVMAELRSRAEYVRDCVCRVGEGELLATMRRQWEEYRTAISMVHDILMYMDRTYVLQQKKHCVRDAGLMLFRDVVILSPPLPLRLRKLILDNVSRERRGEVIDRDAMKAVSGMMMALGRHVYGEQIEGPLLDASNDFYQIEADDFLQHNSCAEYLKKVEARLQEENNRVTAYLDMESEPRLRRVVEVQLVERHLSSLANMPNSGFVSMLEQDKIEDLQRMFQLFSRCVGGIELLRDIMLQHVSSTGQALVKDERISESHDLFVRSLISLRDKYDRILTDAFQNDRLFAAALNRSFEVSVNEHHASAMSFSLFFDSLLRSSAKGGGAAEGGDDAVLDKALALFRFLHEKDAFERYYKSHLAKRLLSDKACDTDMERRVIVALKGECGYQFTSKLEGMFNDISLSLGLMERYQSEGLATDDAFEIAVKVLAVGCWPVSVGVAAQSLPPPLQSICVKFDEFYKKSHQGRLLTWQLSMGHGDVKCSFSTRQHEINLPTLHLLVLLLFNNSSSLTANDMCLALNLDLARVTPILQALACGKVRVLTKEPMSRHVSGTDIFAVDESFSHKLYRFKIAPIVAQKETPEEQQVTREKVEEDRKPVVDAAIVRVMKARQTLTHNALVAECTHILHARFEVSPQLIKKRIESLIEREFLERLNTDM